MYANTLMKNNGVDPVRFNQLKERYVKFLDGVSDPLVEPIPVFDPLNKKALDELHLIREVSKNLQAKKDEDVKKAAQAAAEQKEEAKEEAEAQQNSETKEEKQN